MNTHIFGNKIYLQVYVLLIIDWLLVITTLIITVFCKLWPEQIVGEILQSCYSWFWFRSTVDHLPWVKNNDANTNTNILLTPSFSWVWTSKLTWFRHDFPYMNVFGAVDIAFWMFSITTFSVPLSARISLGMPKMTWKKKVKYQIPKASCKILPTSQFKILDQLDVNIFC